MLGNLFEPCRPALGEQKVRLRNPQFLHFLFRFHNFWGYDLIDAKTIPFVSLRSLQPACQRSCQAHFRYTAAPLPARQSAKAACPAIRLAENV